MSVVQKFPSLQTTVGVETQVPLVQTSDVQRLLSVQAFASFAVYTHCAVGMLQVSSVQGLPSLHWLSAEQPGTQSNSSAPMSGAVPPPLTEPGGPGRVWLS